MVSKSSIKTKRKKKPLTLEQVLKSLTLKSFRRKVASLGFISLLPLPQEDDFSQEDLVNNRKLWRWVLDRAILDILKGGTDKQRKESHNWMFEGDDDFEIICSYADLKPEFIRTVTSGLLTKYKKDIIR